MLNRAMLFDGVRLAVRTDWKGIGSSIKRQILRPVDKLFLVSAALAAFVCTAEVPFGIWMFLHYGKTVLWIQGAQLLLWAVSDVLVIVASITWGKRTLKRLLALARLARRQPSMKAPWVLLNTWLVAQLAICGGFLLR